MRAHGWWWGAVMLFLTLGEAAPSSEEDKAGPSLQEAIKTAEEKDMAEVKEIHRRVVRQLFDGFRLENSLRDGISALENVDEMLRTTIPSLDRFQCLERFMCSIMSSDSSSTSPTSLITSALEQAFDPTFQQGIIQDPSTVSQELLQNPSLQGLLSQGQDIQQGSTQALQGLLSQISSAAQNPVLQQGFPPPNSQFQQGFPPQNPAFQQGIPPPDPALQQGFPPPNPAFQQGFPPQDPAFQGISQNPAFAPPPPPGFHPQFPQQHPPQVFHHFGDGAPFQQFRENPESRSSQRRATVQRPQRRRRPAKPRQRNGFFDFLGRLGLGRRKKRSVLDDLLSGFTGEGIMGILDQMMTRYSFYPYTHAAFMGYSGSPRRCETLYPSCPSTVEETIEVFNNIHRHYPDGIPYKENFPWPLNVLLP